MGYLNAIPTIRVCILIDLQTFMRVVDVGDGVFDGIVY